MKPGDIFQLLKQTFREWSEDKASRLAAALAYYTMFSLGPLLLIAIAIAGLVFGDEAARGAVSEQTRGLMGDQGAQAIETMIAAANQPRAGIVATVVGLATLLFGAAGAFGQLQDALNTIWEVKPRPGRGILGMIKDRFFSLTLVLGIGFFLLVSLVLSAAVAAAVNYFGAMLGDTGGFLLQVVNFVVGFGVITLLFAMMYKVVPDAKIAWSDVWLGAASTALLFTIGRIAIGLYLGNAAVGSAYGAAGSLVVLLVWIYYSAQILFFGAEFTQVYANRYGSRVVPEDDAVQLTEGERAQQGMERKEASEQEKRGVEGKGREAAAVGVAPAHPFPAGVASTQADGSPIRKAIVVASGVIGLAAAGLNMLRGRRDEAL